MCVRPTAEAPGISVAGNVWRCGTSALGQAVADCRVDRAQVRDAPAASAARRGSGASGLIIVIFMNSVSIALVRTCQN